MAPEISHGCPSCGVSVRERGALFCPECGKPLAEKPVTSAANSSQTDESIRPETEGPRPVVEKSVRTGVKDDAATQRIRRPGERTRERLQRASEVARGVTRGVIEEPVKRVEKIRQVSTVVIEEASYDPSLRFVLVALGLFLVFVVLLVLSKVMG